MATATTLIFPLCFFSIVLLGNSVGFGNGERGVPYDYLLLAKIWPPSLCNMALDFPNCSVTQVQPRKYFTVRGLWPQNYTGGTTVNCGAHNDPYAYELLTYREAYFIEDLKRYWPSLSSKASKDVWGEEWRKHGTCSNMNLRQYFHTIISFVKRYDLKRALWSSERKIKPGHSYKKEDLLKAISAKTKFQAGLSCSDDPHSNRQLYEIFLCINKIGVSFIDCPPNIARSSSCPGVIYYA